MTIDSEKETGALSGAMEMTAPESPPCTKQQHGHRRVLISKSMIHTQRALVAQTIEVENCADIAATGRINAVDRDLLPHTDGPIIARAESNNIGVDDVRFFLSTDGGVTTTTFDDQLSDIDPKVRLFPDWLAAMASAYNATMIDTKPFQVSALDTDGSTNFSFSNTRVNEVGNGDWQVRLCDSSLCGNVSFRFSTEVEALAFNQFFDQMQIFVEDNDVRNEAVVCFAMRTEVFCGDHKTPIENLRVGDMVTTRDGSLRPIR